MSSIDEIDKILGRDDIEEDLKQLKTLKKQ